MADIKELTKSAKSFLYADLLEKPDLLTLFRDIDKGGLGLLCIQTRATAALISSFLQTAINPDFDRNFYHNTLYKKYVLAENINAPKIPPCFAGDFFPNIRRINNYIPNIEPI